GARGPGGRGDRAAAGGRGGVSARGRAPQQSFRGASARGTPSGGARDGGARRVRGRRHRATAQEHRRCALSRATFRRGLRRLPARGAVQRRARPRRVAQARQHSPQAERTGRGDHVLGARAADRPRAPDRATEHRSGQDGAMNDTANDAAFVALTAKICRDRGFGAPNYKDTCMRRRIAVRMRARGAADFESYSDLLDSDPGEYEWLIAALTVNVTRLFRNVEAWDAVARSVLPSLWAAPSPRLDCWVAGCASGEEAYTLAALWLRFASERGELAAASRLRMTASDIDPQSLAAAGAGSYADDSFAETPAGVRERWFRVSGTPD